jgi:hypothetical protein
LKRAALSTIWNKYVAKKELIVEDMMFSLDECRAFIFLAKQLQCTNARPSLSFHLIFFSAVHLSHSSAVHTGGQKGKKKKTRAIKEKKRKKNRTMKRSSMQDRQMNLLFFFLS